MNGFSELMWVTIVAAFTSGMVLALLGSVRSAVAERVGLDAAGARGLFAVLNLSMIPALLLAGIGVDRWGARDVLLSGALLSALGVFLLGIGRTYGRCLGALLLAGAGIGCLNAAACALMPAAFFEENPPAATNLGFVFVGLAALLTPALTQLLSRAFGFLRALGLLAALCLTPALIALTVPADAFAPKPVNGGNVLEQPLLWLAALACALYGPLEGLLGRSLGRYLDEIGFTRSRAAVLVAVAWVVFLGARLLASYLQQRRVLSLSASPWLVPALALGAAVALGHLAGTHTRGSSGLGVLALAACLGPIFPTLVGRLFENVGAESYGTAYGTMIALGTTGSLVLSLLVNPAPRTPMRTTYRIFTGGAVALLGIALTMALI